MTLLVLLDSGPLGLVTNPRMSADAERCQLWLDRLLASGHHAAIPEITDYEVRRELVRARSAEGIARLDSLALRIGYLPLTTIAMRKAAEFWAQARQQGRPTADPHALDGDVILVGQAAVLDPDHDEVVIATMNVGHLAQLADAREWQAIL